MEEFSYTIKVPKERIAVLIGKSGETKTELEEVSEAKIDIDSVEGDVTVTGSDAIRLYTIREVIKAVARGFSPDVAKQLLKQDSIYEQINITEFVKNKNHLPRLKGRVIGTEGKSRKTIEELSEANICVYGKTVGVIGKPENVDIARRAVESILAGSPHANVYKWLEKKRREFKRAEFEGNREDMI